MDKNPTIIAIKPLKDVPQTFRNCHCPGYDTCLTAAAFQDLDLHCTHCRLKNARQKELIFETEVIGCISLIKSVYVSSRSADLRS